MPIPIYIQNHYDSLFNCFDDIYSLTIGCFFPSILFGKTYEKSNFGNCLTGCLKMSSLYFIFSISSMILYLHIEYDLLFSKQDYYLSNFDTCKKDNLCEKYINIDNSCLLKNNTQVCDCLQHSYTEYCDFNTNKLPEILNNLTNTLFIISILQTFIYSIIIGIFSLFPNTIKKSFK